MQTVLGFDTFSKALDHYHTKFRFGNATPAAAQWVECMEEVGGV